MVNISIEEVPVNFLIYGGIVLGLAALIAVWLRNREGPEPQTSSTGTGSWLEPDGTDALDGSRATKWS